MSQMTVSAPDPGISNERALISIVIPTYREAENLSVLIPRIFEVLYSHSLVAEVIIVDDNSPDETRAICDRLQEHYPLQLIVRTTERGLSSAVIHGMRQASGEMLVVMDADLSHPPESLPDLIYMLRQTSADFVIGSRYVDGGATDASWGVFRKWNSQIATLLARPLTRARDPMAGFFAIQRDRVMRNLGNLNPIGYKIGLELMVKCQCQHIAEVPITFANRLYGTSKLSLWEQLRYLRHVLRLMKYKYCAVARPIQFALVGLSGMAVDLALFTGLMYIIPLWSSRAVAIVAAMTWNFLLNRCWTFSESRGDALMFQFARFCAACAFGGVVNWSVSVWLSSHVPLFATQPQWAAIIGVCAGYAANYVLSHRFAFRLRQESHE